MPRITKSWLVVVACAAAIALALFWVKLHQQSPPSPFTAPASSPAGGSLHSTAPQPTWTVSTIGPGGQGSGYLTSAACATSTLCVAGYTTGSLYSSAEAAGGTWRITAASNVPTVAITALSCASPSLCVGANSGGDVIWSTRPNGYGVQPPVWVGAYVDARSAVTGLACPTTSLCVAVDSAGNILTSVNPTGGAAAWPLLHAAALSPRDHLAAVACAGIRLCIAAVNGTHGSLLATTDPTGGAATWRRVRLPAAWNIQSLDAVSCFSGGCLAANAAGDILASPDPAGGSATWHLTTLPVPLAAVSCGAPNLCVAAGGDAAYLTSHPLARRPHWKAQSLGYVYLQVVAASCPSDSFCMLGDRGGDNAVYQN